MSEELQKLPKLPWKIDREYFAIRDIRGNLIAHYARQSDGSHEANAQLIVSAKNSHEELLGIANEIVLQIGGAVDNDQEIIGFKAVDFLVNVLLPRCRAAIVNSDVLP